MIKPTQVDEFRNLRTTDLVEIDKFELIYKGHSNQIYTYIWDNFPLFHMKNIINGKRCVGECRKMQGNRKYEHKNIPCEIFYVVSVLMSGEILKGQKFGRYRPDRNQGRLFFNF